MAVFDQVVIVGKFVAVFFSHSLSELFAAINATIYRRRYRLGDSPRNIVIVGASFAGYHAAKELAKSLPSGYRVILIEKNDHFQFTWVFPRFSVVGGHEHKAFIPYGGCFKGAPDGSCLQLKDEVFKITKNVVELKSGEKIDYAYLLLATGSQAELPSRVNADNKPESIELLEGLQGKIAAANDLVVLGGGAAGVELAGDAKEQYPTKNVTLIHSRDRLLNTFGPKLGEVALKVLTELEVNVILNERVSSEQQDEGVIILHSGQKIPCDLLVRCVGQNPNSGIFSDVSPSSISPTGHILVNPTMQVLDTDMPNVFAAGDLVDVQVQRNSRAAVEQATVAARNIVASIRGKSLKIFTPQWWHGGIDLTLGISKHAIYFGDGQRSILWEMKAKAIDLNAARIWKYMGVKPFEDKDNDKMVI